MHEMGEAFWAQQVQAKTMEIARLKKEIEALKAEIARRDKEKYIQYSMLSDMFQMRRQVELMAEQLEAAKKEIQVNKDRAERAERGVHNLRKWMEIKGVKGGYLDLG